MASVRTALPRLAMATPWFSFLSVLCLVLAGPALAVLEVPTETTSTEGALIRASRRPTEKELVALQDRLGYKFKELILLIDALTHSSFSEANNDVLHVVGEKSVEQAIALHLILQKPHAKISELDTFIKKHSNRKASASNAVELGLDSLIMVGKGVATNNTRILSAAFNAVFGAITVDSGSTTANVAFWTVKKWNDHRVDTI